MIKNKGFTLIELLITLAIVGILTSIALPSYIDYTRRGYVTEATGALSNLRARLEQYYQDNYTYENKDAFISPCVNSTTSQFAVTCTANATTYTITATGNAGGPMDGFIYTIDQTGAQTTQSPWNNNTAACWVTRPGVTC